MQKIDRAAGTIRPFNEGDFTGCDIPDFPKWGARVPENAADYYTNENSITTSGLYLASQCYRYKVTGDNDALEQAHKAFNSLRIIYEMGVNDGQPGYLGKPYGFKISDITVCDQYIHASWGLFEFYDIAGDETKKIIEEMSVSFAQYWKGAGYRLVYHGNPWDMNGEMYSYNAILVMLNVVAWKYSKNDEFLSEAMMIFDRAKWHVETSVDQMKREIKKILDEIKAGKKVSKGMFNDQFLDYIGDDEFIFWEGNIHNQFVALSADIINRVLPDLLPGIADLTHKWMGIWEYGIGADLAPYYWYAYNAVTDGWRSLPLTPLLPKDEWEFEDRFSGYLSEIRWCEPLSRSMQAAEVAYIYAENEKKAEAKGLALKILNAIDETRMRWMFDFDGKQLQPELRHMYDILSSEVPSTWLATYWRGRLTGMIQV